MSIKKRIFLSLVSFMATALVVYSLVVYCTKASPNKQSVSAEIYQKASPLPAPTKVIERLRSDEHLARSLERIRSADDPVPSELISRFRKALVIEPLESTQPKSLRLRVTVHDSDLTRAIALANSLVRQYAGEEHVRLETTIGRKHQLAQQSTRQAFDRWIAAERQWMAWQSTQPRSRIISELPPKPQVAKPKSKPPRPVKMVENPEWIALFEEVADLTRRRADMLDHMTSLHPQVQYVEQKIEALESQRASLPNLLPEVQRKPKSEAIPPSVEQTSSTPTPTENPELERLFNVAWKNHENLKQQEQKAEMQMLQNPDVEIVLATQNPADLLFQIQPRALIAAIGIGLFFASGVVIMSGFQVLDKPFSSADKVESTLSIPVLGRISLRPDDGS